MWQLGRQPGLLLARSPTLAQICRTKKTKLDRGAMPVLERTDCEEKITLGSGPGGQVVSTLSQPTNYQQTNHLQQLNHC